MAQSLGEAVIEVGADLDNLEGDLSRGFSDSRLIAKRQGDKVGEEFTKGIDGRLRDSRGRYVKAGEDIGEGIGSGLGRGFGRGFGGDGISTFGQLEFSLARVAGASTGLIGAIVPLPALLGGVVAGAVAVGGALGQAAGGALTAGTVFASLGLAAATVSIASKGLGEAFQAQSKAQEEMSKTGAISAETQAELDRQMQNLAPSARGVLTAVQALGPAWTGLQKAVQGEFFRGVGADLRQIGETFLPVLQRGLVGTAGVLNGAIRGFADFITQGEQVQRIDTIIGSLNSILAAILPAIGNVARGLFALFGGTLGPAREMATAINDATAGFAGWAEGIAQSGQLTEFLTGSNAILGTLVRTVGNIGSILVSVFGAGAAQGATLLNIFEQATGQLAAFLQTAEASEGLAQFFGLIQQSGEAIRQLGSVAVPIFSGIFSVIGALLPVIAALRNTLLPVAQVLGNALGGALTALAPVLGFIIGLVVRLIGALAPLVSTILTGLGAAIEKIAGLFMDNLAPAIDGIIPVLEPILGVFLKVFGGQVMNAINLIVDVIGGVFKILGGLITFLTGVFTGDWKKAWKGIQTIFDGVVDILGGLVKFLWNTIKNAWNNGGRDILNAVRNWASGIISSFVNWQVRILVSVARWVIGIVSRFLELRSRVLGFISSLWANARNMFQSGVSRLALAVTFGISRIISTFARLPGQIIHAVGSLGSLLYNAGQNVVQGLINGIASMISSLASKASEMAGTIRDYLPFSPAKEGPLSGLGNPEQSGKKIAEMVGEGITQNVNVPARAMQQALAPIAPGGSALAPLRRTAQTASTGTGVQPVAAQARGGDVTVTQIFTGPTTSGGRLQEMNWNIRYATQARRETIDGVAR